jgi:DNA (cytosine-5)-methyltransferase 1
MNELALFAGAGGGILGGKLLGWRTVCAVEIEPYAASVLVARQNDGILPPFPVWDDVCTFDGRPWCGIVDVISGGFPCQDISVAGKGAGITGQRSGLWKEFARIICEVRPRFVLVENSPVLTSRGLGVVLGDLAALGYDAEWGVVSAADAGAPHLRERIWIVGSIRNADDHGQSAAEIARGTTQRGDDSKAGKIEASQPAGSGEQFEILADSRFITEGIVPDVRSKSKESIRQDATKFRESVPNADEERLQGQWIKSSGVEPQQHNFINNSWWSTEPDVGRVVNGLAARVDRLKAIGNGQVPGVVRLAWKTLTGLEV